MDRLIGMEFVRYFTMMRLKMQLWLFECVLIDWLGYVSCMACIMYRERVISWNQYCGSSSTPGVKCKISCIVRKDEKQIQILYGY
jgi:hypothetical protein